MLNDFTVVIPTYERPRYINRSISFWKNYPFKVIILDGSKEPIKELIKYANINYHHLPTSFFDRLKYSIDLVDTKYVSLLSDDEFYLPSAIKSCISELENDQSLIACGGQCVGFKYKNGQVVGRRLYHILNEYALLSDSPNERMISHMGSYVPRMIFSVMKSEIWKKLISIISSEVFDVYALFELQFEIGGAFYGKSKTIQELFWLRSQENIPIRGEKGFDPSKGFHNWWKNEKKDIERKEFLNHMVTHLTESKEESNSKLEKALIQALDISWRRQDENIRSNNSFKLKIYNLLRTNFYEIRSHLFSIKLELNRLLNHNHQISKLMTKLEKQNVEVDVRELNKIIKIVDQFHCSSI